MPDKAIRTHSTVVSNTTNEESAVKELLSEAEHEVERFSWDGTFADYLSMVVKDPKVSRLSHSMVYDAILSQGIKESPTGDPMYDLFEGHIFGMDEPIERIIQYLASAAKRLEVRKRILLLLGPPASGKSTLVALMKEALERFSKTDEGAVYAIKGCPMQEEPLHLIPHELRSKLFHDHDIYIEGDLCPKCRYVLRTRFHGRISKMPVERVVYSEHEAVGIGYYVATNPNPTDASLLVGSIDTTRLEGDRLEVAGRAFRLDGELNVANRGLMEFVEIFKANKHLLTALLGVAQERLIKMERFGSVYSDEVIIGHSNEGDFTTFTADEHSEALSDRLIAIQMPYNLGVHDEVKIYEKMVRESGLENTHLSPLTLSAMSIFSVLSRLEPPARQGMSLLDKLRLYDGEMIANYSSQDLLEIRRHHPGEGMNGISPRYVMNRLSTIAASPDTDCVSPLNGLDSLWQGLREHVSLAESDHLRYIDLVKDTVQEHNKRAIFVVQKAATPGFEHSALELQQEYIKAVEAYFTDGDSNDREMRDMEKHVGISDRGREGFRSEIYEFYSGLKKRRVEYDYTIEPRLKAASEVRLLPTRRKLERLLTMPRFAKQRVEWRRIRNDLMTRLVEDYAYCGICADDTIKYVTRVLKSRSVMKTPKNEGIEWQWDLNPKHLENSKQNDQ